MIDQDRAAMQQALNAVCGAKLCEFNSMSSRREQQRLMDEATTILRAALAQQPSATDGRVVIERRDGALYMNNAEVGPGTLEIRRDGVTYRAAERVAVQQPEPVQEPVAGAVLNAEGRPALVDNGTEDWYCKERNARRLYTTPPPRPLLTDEEIWQVYYDLPESNFEGSDRIAFARAIERKVRGE